VSQVSQLGKCLQSFQISSLILATSASSRFAATISSDDLHCIARNLTVTAYLKTIFGVRTIASIQNAPSLAGQKRKRENPAQDIVNEIKKL
jgi:hypothetical protein